MLTISHSNCNAQCDGIRRRDFITAGTLALGGFSLPWLLRNKAFGASNASYVKDKSVVLLFLSGGASHIETFSPNMQAPGPYHSVTGEVQTTLPGVTFGGTFPLLSRHAQKMAIVRSYQHPVADHVRAIKHVLNGGTDPDGRGNRGFSIGSAYTRLRGANDPQSGMPSYVLLNSAEVDPQYVNEKHRVESGSAPGPLGAAFAPFDPGGQGAAQEDMLLNVPRERFHHRRRLLDDVDRLRRRLDQDRKLIAADEYRIQAFDLVLGSAAQAFDLTREDPRLVQRYDTSRFQVGKKEFRASALGHHFLTARRLVEVGCRFVTIQSAGWDMHADGNNPGIKSGMEMLGRPVDQAVSTFLEDLEQRGMSDQVLLIITGDFGRTPTINDRGGRDHWPRLCTLAFAGGGVTGQVIGRVARNNDEPASDPISTSHLMGTVMHSMFDMGQLRVARGVPRELLRTLETTQPIPELL